MKGLFCFGGTCASFRDIGWRSRRHSHLWSYNLHYFDYALDLASAYRETGHQAYVERFVELALDWISATHDGQGDGWDPYPIATRTVNWIYALAQLENRIDAGSRAAIFESLQRQVDHLERRVEWHLLANHLHRNLHALSIASLFFSGERAAQRRAKWLPLLWQQGMEQILPDGGHFERSPMYHAIALADFLEATLLAQSVGVSPPTNFMRHLGRMWSAQAVLMKPNGDIHLFNDSAHGIAPSADYLLRLATQAGFAPLERDSGLLELPLSGYYGYVDAEAGDRILIDCGEPGPSYQLGHAHCDLLSFELDVGGRPMIVDSGVCSYADDAHREYARSTRAHNTVSVAGHDQHEMWGSFRVARRAIVRGGSHKLVNSGYEFQGKYAPYFQHSIEHRRRIQLAARTLVVTDTIHGARGSVVSSYLHFAPGLVVTLDNRIGVAHIDQVEVEVLLHGFDEVNLVIGEYNPMQGWHCSEFGRPLPAATIAGIVQRASDRPFGYSLRWR